MSKQRTLIKSFGYAFTGVREAFKYEPNFKIHISLGVVALFAAFFLGFTKFEWLLLTFTIFFVLIVEMLNTVLEKIVDIVSPEINEKARIAKDVSAAAVLFSAIMALLVAAALFIPKL